MLRKFFIRISKPFYLAIIIACFGIWLRLINFDTIPPFGETMDEFLYPWAGMSWLKTGTPQSWTLLSVYPYTKQISLWGNPFTIAGPWLEKPPLYTLLMGAFSIINGFTEFSDVRLSSIRLVPIFLSFFTMVFIYLLGKRLFSVKVGILATLFYATTPTIVLANRLSLTENLLTPLLLLLIIIFYNQHVFKKRVFWLNLMGLLSGLIILTKQSGVAAIFVIAIYFISQKKWRDLLIYLIIAGAIGAIYPLVGYYYGWPLFINSFKNLNVLHSSGLPELVINIFRFPIIGDTGGILLDGIILLGYILLFSSPWWLASKRFFLAFAFAYIGLLALLGSGVGEAYFFGWYLYPLYPFIVLLIGVVLIKIWHNLNYFALLPVLLVIGTSSVRLLLLSAPQPFQFLWKYLLLAMFLFCGRVKKSTLLCLLFILLIINIFAVFNLKMIYPFQPQPLL